MRHGVQDRAAVSRFDNSEIFRQRRLPWSFAESGQGGRERPSLLLAVKFDDELLVDGQVDVFTPRQGQNTTLVILAVDLKPSR